MEGGKEGGETPGTMSSDDSTEAVDNKRPCADDSQIQAVNTEKRIQRYTADISSVISRLGNNEPEERTEGLRTTAAPSLNLTGVTGGAVGTSNMAGVNYGEMGNTSNTCNINTLIVTIPDHLCDLLERTKEETECMTSGMVRVSAVDDVLNKMKVQRWITITGNAGDGKTTLGYLILKEFLQKNVRIFTVYKPEEYDQIATIKDDKVIMFDDRFGAFLADQQLIKSWFDVIQKILRVIEGQNPKIQVIFISRKNVVNESEVYLGRLTDSIFDRKSVIDLSKRKLTVERLKILEYHLWHENVTVDPETIARVCNREVAHGFPHCCKMFSKLKSKGYDVPIEEFFESPLKFLDMTTKVLYNETCRNLFQLMIQNDGKLDVYNIEDVVERQALLKVEKEQEGSYITVWRDGICQFAHPSVYESVLNVINDIDPLYCVQYATLSVIRQKMIISTSEEEEDNSRAPCYIIVKPIPAVLKALAERFREELLKGDYSMFKHRLCQSREFCEALVFACKEKKQFINQPGKDGQTMLWTALKSGNMVAVRTLVKAGADVEIHDRRGRTRLLFDDDDDERGRTPLQYLCQLENSPAANASGDDYYDDDERGRTPLQYLCQLENSPAANASGDGDDYDDDDDDEREWTPMQYPCQLENSPAANASGDDYYDDDERGWTPMQYPCQLENSPAANASGDDYCDDDERGWTPMQYPCQLENDQQHHRHMETIQVIITEGRGDVNIRDQYGQTPLHYICQLKTNTDGQHSVHMETVRVIIIEGRGDVNDPDQFGQTPLLCLFKCQTLTCEEIKWIITDANGDLNKYEHKTTQLHYLCAYSGLQLDTVDLVINEGKADFNTGDEHGTTPLHYLSGNDNVQYDVVLRVVNTARGDLNKQDDNGITPLHVLCKGSLQVKNVLTLINKGDKADSYGNTPLHFLCRRRGISDDEIQQLKQLPELNMKKQNKLGYTPLDYLNDQDGSLPWTDGMIARSAADLVLCRVKHGDTSTIVLGRAMILNSQKVCKWLQVEDFGRELNNMSRSGERNTPGQFEMFYGTCSSPLPLPPSPSPLTSPSYWETLSTLRWWERGVILLEMGVKEGESNMDERWVSDLRGGVGVSVWGECRHHPGQLCIQVWRRGQEEEWVHQVGECVSLPLPTSGVEVTFTFGLVLDVGRGRVAFLDVGRGKLLCKLDLKFTQRVFPMFCVSPLNDECATRMRLVSGREISVTDQKIQLIQQALSD